MSSAPSPLGIAVSLRSRLPAELHTLILPFAELIAARAQNQIDDATFIAKAPPAALAALGDQLREVNDTLINFGAHSQYGDVEIGDVVRGSKIVINLAGTQSCPLGSLPLPPARYKHTSPALPERLIGRDKLFQTLNTWLSGPGPLLTLEAHGDTGFLSFSILKAPTDPAHRSMATAMCASTG